MAHRRPGAVPPAMLALYAEARARAGPSSAAAAFNPRAEETDHLDQRLDRHSLLGSIARRDDTSTSPGQMRLLRHLLVRAPEWLVRRAAPALRTRGSAAPPGVGQCGRCSMERLALQRDAPDDDPDDPLRRRDLLERIALDQQQVGALARFNGPE